LYSSFFLTRYSILSFTISCFMRQRRVLPPELLEEDSL
jgi:hypothetical protein